MARELDMARFGRTVSRERKDKGGGNRAAMEENDECQVEVVAELLAVNSYRVAYSTRMMHVEVLS